MSRLIPKSKLSIKKLANEMWLIPTLLLVSLIIIESIHLHAHYEMQIDVNSYCTGFIKKNREFLKKFN
jgi:hypothetical protein